MSAFSEVVSRAHPGVTGVHAMITILGYTLTINWIEFIDTLVVVGALVLVFAGMLYINGKRQQAVARQQAVVAFFSIMLGVVIGMFLVALLGVV